MKKSTKSVFSSIVTQNHSKPATPVDNGRKPLGKWARLLLPGLLFLAFSSVSTNSYAARSMALSGGGNPPTNICQGATDVVIYSFQGATGSTADGITGVTFVTNGSLSGTDIVNFKVWKHTNVNTFAGSTQMGGAITTGLGAGTHTLTFTSQNYSTSATVYYFITVSVSPTAAIGGTVGVYGYGSGTPGAPAVSTTVPFTWSNTTIAMSGTTVDGGAMTVSAAPTVASLVGSPNPVCTGQLLTLTAGATTGTGAAIQYNWSGPNSYAGTTASNSTTLTPPTTAGSGVYSVTVTYTGLGCVSAAATSNVTVNQTPTITTSPTSAISCSGGNVSSVASGGTTYLWMPGSVASPTLTVAPGTATVYTVTGTTTGCSSTATFNVTLSTTPTVTYTTQPGGSTCGYTNATYTTQSGMTGYSWTIPGTSGTDYNIISGGTASDNSTVIEWLTGGSKTVTVNYISAGCVGATPASNTTVVTGPPTILASAVSATALATSATINWTSGNGNGRIVVISPISGSVVVPTNNGSTSYTANTVYGSGSATGTNNYVVYAGTGASVTVTNLAPVTAYTATVYEYNNGSGCWEYSPGASATFTTQCNGTPSPGSASVVPGGGNASTLFTLSLPAFTLPASTGITYQWQSSPNGSSWTDITPATTSTYTFTGITANTFYRCKATCTLAGDVFDYSSTAEAIYLTCSPNAASWISAAPPASFDLTTPGAGTWQVPGGVTSVTIDIAGAAGGGSSVTSGSGGEAIGTFAVTPLQTLYYYVGSQGSSSGGGSSFGGGEDGGNPSIGNSYNGGGGAGSDVRTAAGNSATRMIVGGGGGGGLYDCSPSQPGGNGGNPGSDGGSGSGSDCTPGGAGATTGGPGAGGCGDPSANGSSTGQGGAATPVSGACYGSSYAAGGGGGYYGGGGAATAAGGGGLSYALTVGSNTLSGSPTYNNGVNPGNGYLHITWSPPGGNDPSYGVNAFSVTAATGANLGDAGMTAATTSSTGYLDRTGLTPVVLYTGASYSSTVSFGTLASYQEAQVWIDFNDNGTFETSEEVSAVIGYNSVATINPTIFNITIPAGATTGNHLMRIRGVEEYSGGTLALSTHLDPCLNQYGGSGPQYNYGNVADYVVSIRNTPAASATPPLNFGSIALSTTSASQTFSITASALYPTSGNLTVTAPANYSVSLNGTTWLSSVSVPYTSGTLTNYPVYVEFNAPGTTGVYSGTVTVTGGTLASAINEPVSGIAATACSGTPAPGTASVSPNSGATGTVFTLNATGYTLGLGITYQWQSSADGLTGWTNIPGATTIPYTFTTITANTFYHCVTTCSSGPASNTSSVCEALLLACAPTAASWNDNVLNTVNFTTVGSTVWAVPAGVTSIIGSASGANGGSDFGTGGTGGYIQAQLAIPGGTSSISIYVGGAGSSSGAAGFNGGGTGSAFSSSGGGGSDIRIGGTALTNRVLVAGGGGGDGNFGDNGGNGGGLTGGAGGSGSYGGGGGGQYSGGNGGTSFGTPGGNGTLGVGGNGVYYAGGGGGGYYGGGGGSEGAGGGGSNYSSGTIITNTQGGSLGSGGNGKVTISYYLSTPPNQPTYGIDAFSVTAATGSNLSDAGMVAATTASTGYLDHTSLTPIVLYTGSTYASSVTWGTATAYQEAQVWIDFNNNGSFESSEEVSAVVGYSTSGTTSPTTFNITVPAGAATGNHLMRVRGIVEDPSGTLTLSTHLDPCLNQYGGAGPTYNYGNATDYTVTIRNTPVATAASSLNFGTILTSTTSASQTFSITASSLYPASGNLTVTAPANYNVSLNGTTWSTSVSVPYTSGSLTNYPIYVEFIAPASAGVYSGSVTVTGGLLPATINLAVNGAAAPACSGTPAAGTANVTPGSGNGTTVFTLNDPGYSLGFGLTYQWQKSADGVTGWTDIPGATTIPYSFTGITANTFYQVVSTCSYSSMSNTSSVCEAILLGCATTAPSWADVGPLNTYSVAATSTAGTSGSWSVPAGVSSVIITVAGGKGGSGPTPTLSTGGAGGVAQATFTVTPTQALYYYVGGAALNYGGAGTGGSSAGGGEDGGVGNGADWGGGGGGGTDVRTSVAGGATSAGSLASRIIVGGGGGGAAYPSAQVPGGAGGNPGVAGTNNTGTGGAGATTTGPGAGGSGAAGGSGGNGGGGTAVYTAGGGGGFFGGGAGFNAGGGGGSSNIIGAVAGTSVYTTGGNAGQGYVQFQWGTITSNMPTYGINAFNVTAATGSNLSDAGMVAATTASTGYLDRTSLAPIVLYAGGTYASSVTWGTATAYQEAQVWIDFNNNGYFEPSEEVTGVVGYSTSATTSPTTFNITLPAGAATGNHLMRVRGIVEYYGGMRALSSHLDPCLSQYGGTDPTYNYGNAADYIVTVRNTPAATATPALNFGTIVTSTTSASQTFSITANSLYPASGNLTVIAPANYNVSLNGTTWSTSVSVPYTSGSLTSYPIYVEFIAPASAGVYSGSVTVTGGLLPTAVNLAVTGSAASPCSGTPAAGTASITPESGSSTTTYTLDDPGYSLGVGITYQWQSSPDGVSGWTDIPGATTIPYTLPGISATAYYRCVSTCSYSTMTNTSSVAEGILVGCVTTAPSWAGIAPPGAFDVTTAGSGTWQVPAGVTSVHIDIAGAAGGGNGTAGSGSGDAGGGGGEAIATFAVTPLQTLYYYVGSSGSTTTGGSSFGGGEDGGTPGSAGIYNYGGGAGSDVRTTSGSSSTRLIVGGGGGGGVYDCQQEYGGNGGNPGSSGSAGGSDCSPAGAGATTSGPGAGGCSDATANGGATGQGGSGITGNSCDANQYRAGGGGGYYGGGGAITSGGGGGLSYAVSVGSNTLSGSPTYNNGNNTGDGYLHITWTPASGNQPSYGIDAFNITAATGANLSDAGMVAATTASTGYLDRLSLTPIVLYTGGTYASSVTWGSATAYQEAQVWIDFNDNGFYEPSEEVTGVVGYSASSTTSPTTFNITIPAGATTGNHNMRVRGIVEYSGGTLALSSHLDPCLSQYGGTGPTYNYGNAADYVVTIRNAPAATAGPSLNFGTIAVSTTSASQTFSITASSLYPASGNLTVTAPANYNVSLNGTTWSTSVSVPYTSGTLTSYPVYVEFLAPATTGIYTGTVTVTGGLLPAALNVPVTGSAASPCSGTPAAGTANVTPGSGNSTTVFTLNDPGYTLALGINYQWQSSPDGLTGWTDIPGATTIPYTLPGITANTFFRVVSNCSFSSLSNTSSVCEAILLGCTPTAASWDNSVVHSQTFNYLSAASQSWVVPAGVTKLLVDAQGARGGGTQGNLTFQSNGGGGGRVQITGGGLTVVPGHTLTITVGQRGQDGTTSSLLTGGYGDGTGGTNGAAVGSWPGASGGGGTSIYDGGTALVYAGGGGGGGGDGAGADNGGWGGGLTGGAGQSSACGTDAGGQGGTQSAGGAASTCSYFGAAAGAGHNGGNADPSESGGGGGGGWFGGGGGANGAGGGGGSSYVNPTYASVSDVTHTQNFNQDATGGTVVFQYYLPAPPNAPTYGIDAFSVTAAVGPNLSDAGMVSASTASTGYLDRTSLPPITLYENNSYASSATWGTASAYQELQVWIDFNNNGNFEPSEEVTGVLGYSTTSTVNPTSFNIAIPCGVPTGNHLMRIRGIVEDPGGTLALSTHLDPCLNQYGGSGPTYNNGNVADYIVNVQNAPCSGTPDAGSATATPASGCDVANSTLGLTGPSTCYTGLTYQWQYSPDGSGYSSISGATSLTYSVAPTSTTYYRCKVTCSGSGLSNFSTAITVTVTPTPTITGTTPGTICGAGTVTIGATPSAGVVNWYAAATGGPSLATGTTYTPVIPSTTTYYAEALNNGCPSIPRTPVTANSTTVPTITSTTPGTICNAGTVTLGATADVGTVNWYASAIGGSSLATGTTYTPSVSATTTYYVDANNSGCITDSRTSVIATVHFVPAHNITGGGTYCISGSGVHIGLDGSQSGIRYELYKDGSPTGNIQVGAGGTVDFGLITAAGNYTAVGTNTVIACSSPMTGSTTVSVSPTPVVHNVTGGGSYCSGGTGVDVTLLSTDNIVTYQLFNSTGAVSGLMSATGGASIDFGPQTGAGTYTVVANPGSACATQMSGNPLVTILTAPGAIEGIPSACTGLTTVLSDASAGSGTWSSSNSAVATIDPLNGTVYGQSLGTSVISFTLSSTGCIATTTLTVNATPSAITGAPATLCVGTNIVLSESSSGGVWSSGNTSVFSIISASGAVTAAGPGTATVAYTAGSGCAAISTLTVNALPTVASITATSGTAYCTGGTLMLAAGAKTGTGVFNSYNWSGPSGYTSTTTAGNTSLMLGSVADAGVYSLTVTYAGIGCTSVPVALPIPITINPAPALTSVSNSGPVCAGNDLTLSATGPSNVTGYSWAGPVAITSGGSTATATVSPGAAGIYTVTVNNGSGVGCSVNYTTTGIVNPLPAAVTVSGSGGPFCGSTTLSASNGGSGTIYFEGTTSNGTSTLTPAVLQSVSASGTYYFRALSIGGCWGPQGSATVSINTLPFAYNITGGGSYCSGGSGVTVGLSGSDNGVSYELFNGVLPAVGVPTVMGNGGPISFGTIMPSGNYTAVATNTLTLCTNTMAGSTTINVTSTPNVYTVIGGGSYCASDTGVHIGLTGSDAGVAYQLYHAGVAVGSLVTGTGSGIDFGLQTAAGTYSVVASPYSACATPMTGGVTVSTNASPTPYAVTGTGSYCPGTPGLHVGLSNSDNTATYQLYKDGVAVGGLVSGTGFPLDFGLQTAGTYSVSATTTSTGCTGAMTGTAVLTTSPVPNAYAVTGGGSYCLGGTGVHVGVSNSTSGVNYQLYNASGAYGVASGGTGSAIDLGLVTVAGTYTVVATDATSGCTSVMHDTAVVVVGPSAPNPHSVVGGGTECANGLGFDLGLDGSDVSVSYQLYNASGAVGGLVPGTGHSLDMGLQTAAGTYTVVADPGTTCALMMTGTATIINTPLPTPFSVTGGGIYCAGGSGFDITLNGSETGVTYQLYKGATPMGGPVTGTTGVLDFGIQTDAGTYKVVATSNTTACSDTMTDSAVIIYHPAALLHTVTGGGAYCQGGNGVDIGLSGSEVGVTYQLYLNDLPTGAIINGTGLSIDFGNQTLAGQYAAVANPASTCATTMTNSVTVTVNPTPTQYTLSGGGGYCAGAGGLVLSLDGSQTGISYQLYDGSIVEGVPVAGTGSGINFGAQTTAGTYSVLATNTVTGCSMGMGTLTTVTVDPLPTVYTVTGGGSYCAGGAGVHIGLSNSATGVNYRLYNGSIPVGILAAGTGHALDLGVLTTAGTYTVAAIDASSMCGSNMSGSAVVTVNPLPVVYNVTGGGHYCAGGTGPHITLSGSATGVNYQLYNETGAIGLPVAGTNAALDFGSQTSQGTYTVVATSATGCQSTMSLTATVTIDPLPTIYAVTGGGQYCASGAGVHIGVANSTTGVIYQLYPGTLATNTVTGTTGSPVDFGYVTAAGTYSVVAADGTTGCTSNMSGTATVTVNPLPTAYTVSGTGSYCAGGTGLHVTLSGSAVGVSYQLYNNGAIVGTPVNGTNAALDFGLQTAQGTYTVLATNSATGCMNAMASSAVITINAAPVTYTVTGGGHYCTGGTGVLVGTDNSTSGVSYQLYNGMSPVGSPVVSTGGPVSFGLQTAAGTYSVIATNTSGCQATMSGNAIVTVDPLPLVYNVLGGGTYCAGGSGYDVTLSGSNLGINYQLYHDGTALGSYVPGTGSGIDFGVQAAAGVYTVTATDATSGCSNPMNGSATIIVNAAPVVFTVTGGGHYCSGGAGVHIGVSQSALGINYQLYNGSTLVTTKPGLSGGAAIDFGLQIAAGTYSVAAVNSLTGCTIGMSGYATVDIDPLPVVYPMSGNGAYCAGGSGVDVVLTNSNTGINYQLYRGITIVGTPLAGSNGNPVDFGNQTIGGSYYVIGSDAVTGCSAVMSGTTTVTVNPLPTVFTVTGGGSYCQGGAGVLIGQNSSTANVTYQLLTGATVINTLNGTNSALNFGLQTTAGTYTVVATDNSTGCVAVMSGNPAVNINTLPAVYSVSGSGAYCSNTPGVDVTLSYSDNGISYQLYNGSAPVGLAMNGVNGTLDFGLQTAGTYTVMATNNATTCTNNMTGSAVITVNAAPSIYPVTGGGSYCQGGTGVHVGLGGSTSGIQYQLYLNGSAVGGAVTGTGSAIDFGLQVAAGTYTVSALNTGTSCSADMSGSAVVTVNPLPNPYVVYNNGGTSYCAGGSGVDIAMSNSDTGVNYQLIDGSFPVGFPVAGTGLPLDFGMQTTAGTYIVLATRASTTCSAYMSGSASVVISPLPTVYTVTGGGGYCTGDAGVHIGLSASNGGVNYQLYRGSTLVNTVAGGSGAIDFGYQTVAGTYSVIAVNATTSCTKDMAGTATVTVNALPTQFAVTGGGNYCAGSPGVHIGLAGSQTGVNYQLYNGLSPVGFPVVGTGYALDFGLQTGTGTYSVVASNTLTTCTKTMTGTVTVGISSGPSIYTVTGGGDYCSGGTGVSISLLGSSLGVNYQLFDGITPGTTLAGTGSALNYGLLTNAGTYMVVATDTTTHCQSNMSGGATVVIDPLPVVFNVTGGGSYCAGDTGIHVTLSGSQAGVNYQLYNGSSVSGFPVAGTGSVLDLGLQTTIGTYTVMATNATTGCVKNMSGSTSVSVNPILIPSVTISTGMGDSVCYGGTTTLTAMTTNGGTSPAYQWQVNGAAVGSSTSSYAYVPNNGDVVTVTMTSNATCARPATVNNTINLSVLPHGAPAVSIAALPGNEVCVGATVTYTATPTYGGTTPVYTWVRNGSPVVGVNGPAYGNIPNNGDIIFCMMSSNYPCRTADSVFSNTLTIRTDTPMLPSVTITADPGNYVGIGTSVTLTAVVTNAGANPHYQWYVGNDAVPGATFSTLTSTNFADLDSVSCVVTSSNACQLSTFNSIIMHIWPLGVTQVSSGTGDISLIPNPNKGQFTIKGTLGTTADQEVSYELTDMLGQVVYKNKVMARGGNLNELVKLNSSLANGMYLLSLHTADGNTRMFHVIVEQ